MLLLLILGFVSFVYWIVLILVSNFDIFNNIWLLFSATFFLFYYLTKQYLKNPKRIPLSFIVPMYVCLILGILVFIISSFIIFSNINYKAEKDLDYLIVLGSKLDKDELSTKSLKRRLDRAKAYIEENPNTTLVLSGGTGEGRTVSEAEVMAAYLLNQGLSTDRILVEIQSHNTKENIIYSFALIQKQVEDKRKAINIQDINIRGPVLSTYNKPKRIGILTSDFHTFRAMALAKNIENEEVYAISSTSPPLTLLNMYLRECFAILKEKFMGYI